MKLQAATAEKTEKMAYSVEDASEQTSLSISTLRNAIRLKKLKARKIGRRVLILTEDLESYLKKDE